MHKIGLHTKKLILYHLLNRITNHYCMPLHNKMYVHVCVDPYNLAAFH